MFIKAQEWKAVKFIFEHRYLPLYASQNCGYCFARINNIWSAELMFHLFGMIHNKLWGT